MEESISFKDFQKYIEEIYAISQKLFDDWKLVIVDNIPYNNKYITKKQITCLQNSADKKTNILVTFDYHIAYNISYSVPVLCFNISKQDGTRLTLEEYWKYNKNLQQYNMYDTLTQMDHPVLNQPFFTLHPCKTQEVLKGFLRRSKNPIISWLSVVNQFVHLVIIDDYFNYC